MLTKYNSMISKDYSQQSNKSALFCDFCDTQATFNKEKKKFFNSASEFHEHLRESHCIREGGSFVCLYGPNGVCPSLPIEGVSEVDYKLHVSKVHFGGKPSFENLVPESDSEKWTVFSSNVNLASLLNNPRLSKRETDFFTKTWGESFGKMTTTPAPFPTVKMDYFNDYIHKTIAKRKKFQAINKKLTSKNSNEVSTLKPENHELTIPKVFFSSDFDLTNPSTFNTVLPWSSITNQPNIPNQQHPSISLSPTSKTSQTIPYKSHSQQQHKQNVSLSSKLLQEKLSHYLDSIEMQISRQVCLKSDSFFQSIMSHNALQSYLEHLCKSVQFVREQMRRTKGNLVEAPFSLLHKSMRKKQYKALLQKLHLMVTVQQTQPTIQLLLSTNDFSGSLDLISTTQEVLSQELSGLHCFRHFGPQLMEVQKVVVRMLREEYILFVTSFLNQPIDHSHLTKPLPSTSISLTSPSISSACKPIDQERLVLIGLGLYRDNNSDYVDLLFNESCTSVKSLVKQTVIEVVSSLELNDADNKLTAQVRLLGHPQWLLLLCKLFFVLLVLLCRLKSISDVLVLMASKLVGVARDSVEDRSRGGEEGKSLTGACNTSNHTSSTGAVVVGGGVGEGGGVSENGVRQSGVRNDGEIRNGEEMRNGGGVGSYGGIGKGVGRGTEVHERHTQADDHLLEFLSDLDPVMLIDANSPSISTNPFDPPTPSTNPFDTDTPTPVSTNPFDIPTPHDNLPTSSTNITNSSSNFNKTSTTTTTTMTITSSNLNENPTFSDNIPHKTDTSSNDNISKNHTFRGAEMTESNSSGKEGGRGQERGSGSTASLHCSVGAGDDDPSGDEDASRGRESGFDVISLHDKDWRRNVTLMIKDCEALLSSSESSKIRSRVQDIPSQVFEFINHRLLKLFSIKDKDDYLDKLTLSEFLQLWTCVQVFVQQAEHLVARRCTPLLKGHFQTQAGKCVKRFHEEKKNKLCLILDNERWKQADVPREFQRLVDHILSSDQMTLPSKLSDTSLHESKSGGGDHLIVAGEKYVVVGTVLMLLKLVVEYCEFAEQLPSMAVDVLHKLVELLKNFNSRTCQLILGAGALQLVGLKTINTINLGLASRCLQLVVFFLPRIKRHFQAKLSSKTMPETQCLKQLDHLNKDFNDHISEISVKMVSIMDQVLLKHINKYDMKSSSSPSSTFEAISKQTLRFIEATTDLLPRHQMEAIITQFQHNLALNLNKHLSSFSIKTNDPHHRKYIERDLEHYTSVVQQATNSQHFGITIEDVLRS